MPAGIVLQLEVKAHADAGLARRTAEAVCERLDRPPRRGPVEVLSFHTAACEAAAARGLPARLVAWADYAPTALARWARRHGVGGICVEHFLLSHGLVGVLRRAGLSVTTGTVNEPALLHRVPGFGPDAITTDRPVELRDARGAALRRLIIAEPGPMIRGCPSITGSSGSSVAKPAISARAPSAPAGSPSRRSRRGHRRRRAAAPRCRAAEPSSSATP